MSDRSGIFAGDDPLKLVQAWLTEAEAGEMSDANAMVLSTVDADGMPDSRVVLLKEVEPDALVFYTNYESRKGGQLAAHPMAAVNFHWKSLQRQIRVRGRIERVSADQSDTYYASRPLGSRIGAWVSKQSQPLASKASFMAQVAAAGVKHGTHPDRPPHWGGFRLIPIEFEFWAAAEFRLHDRFRWTPKMDGAGWDVQRLFP